MSTDDYLNTLNIDQLRYFREEADRRIKKAESTPKKVMWQVTGGLSFGKAFKENDHLKALEYYKEQLDESFDQRLVDEILAGEIKPRSFDSFMPKFEFVLINETEYKEFF